MNGARSPELVGKQHWIESYVARLANAELEAVEAACQRARATGRGVRIVRNPMRVTEARNSISATQDTTVEVTSEVPAGTIAYYANGRTE